MIMNDYERKIMMEYSSSKQLSLGKCCHRMA